MLIDDHMPTWDFNEVHATRISAPPERVWQAIHDLRPGELPAVRLLFALRTLPAFITRRRYLAGRQSEKTVIETALGSGFVLLDQSAPCELVVGAIGRFWQTTGGFSGVKTAEQFGNFADPTYARATMNFYIRPSRRKPGQTLVRTETRILIPDPAARRKFTLYWSIVYPGSALIRRIWLRAIKRRAEAGPE